jgi:two-component system, cell cycle sensor histidine kinase and response regulator CckA
VILPNLTPQLLRSRYMNVGRLVERGAAIGAVVYLLLAAVSRLALEQSSIRQPYGLLMLGVALLVAAFLARTGRPVAGAILALAAPMVEVHISIWRAGHFPTSSMLASSVIVVAASLVFVPRYSLLFALVSIAATWPLAILSPGVQQTGVTDVVIYWLISHTVLTLTVWALISLGNRILQEALTDVFRKERELAETIRSSPDGIVVCDDETLIRSVNPAAERLLGRTEASCLGRDLCEAITDISTEQRAKLFSLDELSNAPQIVIATTPAGERRDIEVKWRAMENGRSQLLLRDISERVKAEADRRALEVQLAHAQRLEAVGQLAGGLAHDFNNLLTIIGTSAEVLREDVAGTEGQELLAEIIAAQQRGAALTGQLLSFARRDVVDPRVFDLSTHVTGVERLLQRVAGESVRLAIDVAPGCTVRADVGQLEQALVNLVTNARDAMPNGGVCTLRVALHRDAGATDWVRLSVRDDGVGMDASTQARVFEPFFTTKPRGRGTGLGLASVHGVMTRSAGRVSIDSRLGVGTAVHLDFPVAHAAQTQTIASPQPKISRAGRSTGSTVLVAEDDAAMRSTVVRLLERDGYTVLAAEDGLAALQLFEEHRDAVDLLLTDVMMPGLRGPELVERVRAIAPGLRVLFMSGYADDALASVPGLRIEMDFLAKPFTGTGLLQRVAAKIADSGAPAQPLR